MFHLFNLAPEIIYVQLNRERNALVLEDRGSKERMKDGAGYVSSLCNNISKMSRVLR